MDLIKKVAQILDLIIGQTYVRSQSRVLDLSKEMHHLRFPIK